MFRKHVNHERTREKKRGEERREREKGATRSAD